VGIGIKRLGPFQNIEHGLEKLTVVQDTRIVTWNVNPIDLSKQGLQLGLGQTVVDWNHSGSSTLKELHVRGLNISFVRGITEEGLGEDPVYGRISLYCSPELYLAGVLFCVIFVLHTV
jgi:hypothetical protein